jgi:hypothetical protein
MQGNLKDILSNLNTPIDEETLMLYIQGKLSPEKTHELERQLLDSEFGDDALEGLQEMRDKDQIPFIVEKLNRDLRKKTEKKKKRREKMRIKDQPWLYISILILFLLIVLAFVVIMRLRG